MNLVGSRHPAYRWLRYSSTVRDGKGNFTGSTQLLALHRSALVDPPKSSLSETIRSGISTHWICVSLSALVLDSVELSISISNGAEVSIADEHPTECPFTVAVLTSLPTCCGIPAEEEYLGTRTFDGRLFV